MTEHDKLREKCLDAMKHAYDDASVATSRYLTHRERLICAFDVLHGLAIIISADRSAAIKSIARLLAARKIGARGNGENLPDEVWQQQLNIAASVFDLLAAGDLTKPPEKP